MKRTTLTLLSLSLLGGTLLQSAAAQKAAAPVTITINGFGGTDQSTVSDLINRFVKPQLAKQNINVVYQPLNDYNKQLTTLLAGGTAGDLFYLDSTAVDGYVATGKVLSLNGRVSSAPFVSTLNKAFTRNGKLYAIAKDFNTLAVVYNKDLFDEAKVPYPSSNDSFTTFADKLTKLKSALGSDYYGICLPADFARMGAFAYANGWKQFDAKGKSNLLDPRFVSAFNFYTGLAKNKVAVQPSELSAGWPGDCLKGGKVGVAIEGGWLVDFLKTNAPNLKYGTALMPLSDTTKKRGNFLYTVGWAINSGTKNQAAALKVLNALTSPQAQEYVLSQGLAIPSRSALASSSSFKGTDAKTLNSVAVFQGASSGNVQSFSFGAAGIDWMKPVNAALAAVLSGEKSSADALKKAQQDMTTFQNR